MDIKKQVRTMILIAVMIGIIGASSRLHADTGTCSGASVTLPFTDVMSSQFFCQIAEAYFSGLANGTSASTFSPTAPVPREQMAAFVTRTLDQSLKRGSRRAALNQYWTPSAAASITQTTFPGSLPVDVKSDGADLWVGSVGNNSVYRVRASDGKLLETWTAAVNPGNVLAAIGKIFVAGNQNPSNLYRIDPTQPPGAATLLIALDPFGNDITFDGFRIWIACGGGAVDIVTLSPLSKTSVSTGFTQPSGILYDGANIWVTDATQGKLFKLDFNGAIIQTVTVGASPRRPVFDGTNIWVPGGTNNASSSLTVVRASTGAVLATLTPNMSFPIAAAFDGERILVTDQGGNQVLLWKASDLSPLGSFSLGGAGGACSDGLNFWIASESGSLARF